MVARMFVIVIQISKDNDTFMILISLQLRVWYIEKSNSFFFKATSWQGLIIPVAKLECYKETT